MNDKDEIKELFQKELGNYQAKVNPNLWNGIQAGLGTAGTATGTASSLGLVGKIIIGVSIATAATIGAVLIINKEDNSSHNKQITTDFKTENFTNKELVEEIELKEENLNNSSKSEVTSIDKDVIIDKISVNSSEKEITKEKLNTKDSNEKNSNSLVLAENIVSLPIKENKTTKIEVENVNTPNTGIKETIIKENSISELAEFDVRLVSQNNQYVSFKVEGVPSNAYVIWDFGDGTIDNSLNTEHFYADAGTYKVDCIVKTDKEEVKKSIEIEINILGEIGDLPNIFTPNGDGNNDEFFVNCKNIKTFQLTIIDNMQNIVYSTNTTDFRWNGFDKFSQPVKEGTYYYIIVAEDDLGNIINKYQQLRLQR